MATPMGATSEGEQGASVDDLRLLRSKVSLALQGGRVDRGGAECDKPLGAPVCQASGLEGVTKTPAALQADLALWKTATAVLTVGSAGKVPIASEVSGAPTITWMDVDVSLIKKAL